MNYSRFLSIFFFLLMSVFLARSKNISFDFNTYYTPPHKPRLVVGIVVDQMRYDYLTRYANRFGDGGFSRLMNEGYNFKNNNFDYIPTYTAPGHATIYTGTSPKYHGIIANDWYDREKGGMIYCVDDDQYNAVGTLRSEGRKSPFRMDVTTFADQNRLHTQFRGKSIE